MLLMLPAVKTGLFADDLPQRAIELRPWQLPPHMLETGLVPADSGSFRAVLFDIFGFGPNPKSITLMKNYGVLPWWTPQGIKCILCRPISAFTHWLDYRLFPNSPALMHLHNIAWFAGVVFLVTFAYRKFMPSAQAAGLAAILFLLDGNTYFPVAFVANRGFFLAMVFGLLYLVEHHRWRTTQSRRAMILSAVFFTMALFAEESGAAAFAFIFAYALVLEPGSFRGRALTLLPSIVVIIAWRIVYLSLGYGLLRVGMYYADPIQHPLHFLEDLFPRDMILLGGQLTAIPPDFLFMVKPSLHALSITIYAAFVVAAFLVFLPVILRDKFARYWLTVTILAASAEAAIVPSSKNLGFIAVGAYGLIACFISALFVRPIQFPLFRLFRVFARTTCLLLLVAHVPGAIVQRIIMAEIVDQAPTMFANVAKVGDSPNIENTDLIVINEPSPLTLIYVPGTKAYWHHPLPKTLRALVPGCTALEVLRADDKTLIVQSKGPNLFSCDDVGPVNPVYFAGLLTALLGDPQCKPGDRYVVDSLTAEILATDASNSPSRVAFHFTTSLDSAHFHWLWFDWGALCEMPFGLPAVGQSVTIPGPRTAEWAHAMNR
jgi:hypothetical protein